MVHRDLKADNVLVSASMEIKICDFGTAARLQAEVLEEQLAVNTRATGTNGTIAAKRGVRTEFNAAKTLAVKGSPLWMAPELLQRGGGRHVTTANDVYSYGHVVCEGRRAESARVSADTVPCSFLYVVALFTLPVTSPWTLVAFGG